MHFISTGSLLNTNIQTIVDSDNSFKLSVLQNSKETDTYLVLHHCFGISTNTDVCTDSSISGTL